jgi:TPR repeat protein
VIAALALAMPVRAGWDEGVGAYNTGDYATALAEFRPLAEAGMADAQFTLGLMYLNGQQVARDEAEAAKWFLKAAEQGVSEAQGSLGALLSAGKGVPRDMVRAYMWFDIAAARGNERAAEVRDAMAEKISPDDLKKARHLARKWRTEHRKLK